MRWAVTRWYARKTKGSRQRQRSRGHYPRPAVEENAIPDGGREGRGETAKKNGDKLDDAGERNEMI